MMCRRMSNVQVREVEVVQVPHPWLPLRRLALVALQALPLRRRPLQALPLRRRPLQAVQHLALGARPPRPQLQAISQFVTPSML